MTLIEGVGDEVVQFMAVVLIVTIGALAWWSTNARPDRYRTVLVMRSRPHHPVTLNIRTSSNMTITNTQAIMSPPTSAPEPVAVDPNATDVIGEVQTSPRVITLREMDSIVDADMAMLDNNRLHFYRRMDSATTQSASESTSDEGEVQEEVEPASNAQIREMDSIVNAMEADVTAGCDFFTRPNDANPDSTPVTAAKSDKKDEKANENVATVSNVNNSVENNETNGNIGQEGTSDVTDGERRKILIKLKYLNDTLKEVDGSLDELLKDFKWRHFSSELTSECRVRLIFNGRVLLDDAATLRACGLHDKAVVHCLVHPKRAANQQRGPSEESQMNATHELITEGAQPERAWDLENILMTLVSVALTVVWFFRCEYSNMFTASASVALFGLTVFYSVAIFGLYLSDTFHFDRRPAAGAGAVPNN